MKVSEKILAGSMALLLATGGFVTKAHAEDMSIGYLTGSAAVKKGESDYDFFKSVIDDDSNLSDKEK